MLWGTKDPREFMQRLDSMSNEELRSWLEKLKKRKRGLESYQAQEQKIYA
jgi:hypothetical protein